MYEGISTDPLLYARQALAVAGLVLLFCAAVIDIRKFIIPNWLNAALLGVGLLFAIVSSFSSIRFDWVTHLAFFVLFFAAGTLLFSVGMLGGGDVKLMAVLAFWAGREGVLGFVIYTALAGGILSAVYLVRAWLRHRREVGSRGSALQVAVSQVVLTQAELMTDGKDATARLRQSSLLREPVPYGVAIAVGGVYVFASITGHLG